MCASAHLGPNGTQQERKIRTTETITYKIVLYILLLLSGGPPVFVRVFIVKFFFGDYLCLAPLNFSEYYNWCNCCDAAPILLFRSMSCVLHTQKMNGFNHTWINCTRLAQKMFSFRSSEAVAQSSHTRWISYFFLVLSFFTARRQCNKIIFKKNSNICVSCVWMWFLNNDFFFFLRI